MIKLGGFIITYNRPGILMDTLDKVFNQSFPPELIWVIDNSEDDKTFSALIARNDSRIKYHHMGYNAGPAGGAVKGLKLCAQEGFDWIYWGDDNDPPFRGDCIERLLAIRDDNPYCGVLGVVGHFFDRKKGVVKRIQSRLLEKKNSLEVDTIAGGMCMLVNGEMVAAEILPNPDLFFGFEELDFCLKARRKGYSLVVNCSLFLEARHKFNKTEYKRPTYIKKSNLNREYYSLRNLLYISDTLTLNSMKKQLIIRWVGKAFYGFRYGPIYGCKNFKLIFMAFLHYIRGIKGKTFSLANE